jgi:hypothetical protein
MTQKNYSTVFEDINGQHLGDYPELLPIPLRQGMRITIHGHPQPFTVVDWKFHHGHPDENTGITVILKTLAS